MMSNMLVLLGGTCVYIYIMEYTTIQLYMISCVCENEGFTSLRCGRFGKIHQWIPVDRLA